jgi:glycine betaine catabolism B
VVRTLPIRDIVAATPRARIVRLALGGEAFPYQPGQAVLVGSHGTDQRRPYSMASAPEDAQREDCLELLVGVDADGGAGPHLALDPHALVDIDGPLGRFTFPDNPDEQRFVFIAGGTGIAPLRAMMRHALHGRHRQIGVLYSARRPGEFAYEAELRELARNGRIELKQTITREIPENWTGPRGRIGRADLSPLVHDPATLCFVCGPPALVEEMPKLLEELGVPRTRIRIEAWG